jgi:hypothetical protein
MNALVVWAGGAFACWVLKQASHFCTECSLSVAARVCGRQIHIYVAKHPPILLGKTPWGHEESKSVPSLSLDVIRGLEETVKAEH